MNPQSFALHVREASSAEVGLVHSVMQAAYLQYVERLDPPSGAHAESVEDVAAAMRRGGAALAFLDDAPAGSVRYRPESDHLYMERLAVLPECRLNGVASALVRFVQSEAERLILPSVRLGVRLVLTDNWRLYLGLGYGFRELHLRPAALGVTVSATMERPLGLMPSGGSGQGTAAALLLEIADAAKRAAFGNDHKALRDAARMLLHNSGPALRDAQGVAAHEALLRELLSAAQVSPFTILGLVLERLDKMLQAESARASIDAPTAASLRRLLLSPPSDVSG